VDISHCWMETQFRNAVNSNQGNDDQGETVELTGIDELTLRKSVHASATSKFHVVYISEWNGPAGATAPIAQHVAGHVDAGVEGAEEGVVNTTITEVGSATNALILGASCSSDGTGNTTPRGQVDFALTSTTNVSETRSETSRDERRFYTVFEWPVGVAAPAELGSRSQSSVAGSEGSQMAAQGSLRSQAGLSGSSLAQPATAGSLRSELGVAGSLGSQSSTLR